MISQLKLLLKILLSTNTVIIQLCLVEAAGNPGKNETDFIAQYRECVKGLKIRGRGALNAKLRMQNAE